MYILSSNSDYGFAKNAPENWISSIPLISLIRSLFFISRKRFLSTFVKFIVHSFYGIAIVMVCYICSGKLFDWLGQIGMLVFWFIWVLWVGAFLLWGNKIKQQSEKG